MSFLTNSFLYGGAAAAPLDGYASSLVGAWSVARRLLTSYTGKLIRVRRSSDNTEQDIGYTGTGDLDTTALLAFCGSGNGFIVTLYDQSGAGNDFAQNSSTVQAQIVSSGTVQAFGTRVGCAHTAPQRMESSVPLTQPTTITYVGLITQHAFIMMYDGQDATHRNDFGDWNGQVIMGAGSDKEFLPAFDNSPHISTALFNSTNSACWIDGSSKFSGDVGTENAVNGLRLWAAFNYSNNATGIWAEMYAWNRDLGSAGRSLEAATQSYFGL